MTLMATRGMKSNIVFYLKIIGESMSERMTGESLPI